MLALFDIFESRLLNIHILINASHGAVGGSSWDESLVDESHQPRDGRDEATVGVQGSVRCGGGMCVGGIAIQSGGSTW